MWRLDFFEIPCSRDWVFLRRFLQNYTGFAVSDKDGRDAESSDVNLIPVVLGIMLWMYEVYFVFFGGVLVDFPFDIERLIIASKWGEESPTEKCDVDFGDEHNTIPAWCAH